MKMGSGTTKKAERLERKKKKLTALLEITKLNDKDREKELGLQNQNLCDESVSSMTRNIDDEKEEGEIVGEGEEEGEITGVDSDGPHSKRHKTNDGQISSLRCTSTTENNGEGSNNDIDKPMTIPTEELRKLRMELKERRNFVRQLPRLLLNGMGEKAAISRDYRTPLFVSDIQHLILHSQMGNGSPVVPRWCSFDKQSKLSHTVVCVIEGGTIYDYVSSESQYEALNSMDTKVEIVSPMTYDGDLVEELAAVPLSYTQRQKLEKRYGSLRQAEINSGLVFRILRSIFPIKLPPIDHKNGCTKSKLPSGNKFSRTELLLSAWQMIEEEYPIPVKGELEDRFTDYVMSKDKYAEVTPSSPMWGLDCEMCLTTLNINELTRISIVDENHKVVYESLVKPRNKITNYLTQFSGITKAIMKGVKKTLKDVQEDLRGLLPPDVILVGQSLNFDLHALKIMHPYVIDTSVIYNLSGVRPRKPKLAILAQTFLGEQIQTGYGHDSVEDSSSSLKLVQLKLAHSVEFGDAVLLGRGFKSNGNSTPPSSEPSKDIFATSLFSHLARQNRSVAVVGKDDALSQYRPLAMIPSLNEQSSDTTVKCQAAQSNHEAVQFTCNEAMYHNFMLVHLKLEEEESLADVDRWTSQLTESLALNGFLITILAGSSYSKAHGACFLHIKRPIHNNCNRVSRYNAK